MERLVVDHRRRGMVPDVKAAGNFSAVAAGRHAVPITVWVAWALLLAVVEVAAQVRQGTVALLGLPRALRLELDVPGGLKPRETSA